MTKKQKKPLGKSINKSAMKSILGGQNGWAARLFYCYSNPAITYPRCPTTCTVGCGWVWSGNTFG